MCTYWVAIPFVETAAEWRARAIADYGQWKANVYDVATSDAQKQLRQDLEVKPDDTVVDQTAAQRVKCAAKQLSSLVSFPFPDIWLGC